MVSTQLTVSAPAVLPLSYVQACRAVAECERIDECKGWADKAEAIAAYARMSGNKELEIQCRRIRLRAVRRIGELLGPPVRRRPIKMGDPARLLAPMTRVAAREIAQISRPAFERMVEGANPPGVHRLARKLMTPRIGRDLQGEDKAYRRALRARIKANREHRLLDLLIDRQPLRMLPLHEAGQWARKYLVRVCAVLILGENQPDKRLLVGDVADEAAADRAMELAEGAADRIMKLLKGAA